MYNINKSDIPLLNFVSKCKFGKSLMFIYIHLLDQK